MAEAYLRQDRELRAEADQLLDEKGLRALLLEYGTVHVSGSYSLQLMVWRDLDIYLEAPSLAVAEFFDLGKCIAQRLVPVRMSFIDNRSGRLDDVPSGLYWGVHLGSQADPRQGGVRACIDLQKCCDDRHIGGDPCLGDRCGPLLPHHPRSFSKSHRRRSEKGRPPPC